MSRVIKTESAGKDRTRLVNAIVLALRELMQQPEPDVFSRDLAAFIALALNQIFATIDQSVNAWEKRGYWVKADRLRMEWEWTERTSAQLREALISDDWAAVAIISAQVGQRFSNVNIPVRNRIGKPWVGAWNVLHNKPGV